MCVYSLLCYHECAFRNANIIEKLSWYARIRPKRINTFGASYGRYGP